MIVRASILLLLLSSAFSASAAEYTTFVGDSAPSQIAKAVADSAGNTYIAGTRSQGQSSDVFVTKLDPSGNTIFFRVVSGTGSNTAADIAIDSAGNIYLGGATSSADFPVHNAFESAPGRGFLLKLSADASQTVWSTYFQEAITALAVDSSGNVYITGSTSDPQFPVTPGLPNGPVTATGVGPVSGAFITKIAAAGDRILYSGVIAGSDKSCGCCSSCFLSARSASGASLAVDAAGNAYLAGNTDTSNIPTTSGAFLATGVGAFAAKVKPDGSGLVYLTYLGATDYPISPTTNPANIATSIACDVSGNAYLTGTTSDPEFPATSGAWQTVFGGPVNNNSFLPPSADAFALKLNPAGTGVIWASYLGGTGVEAANSIAVDASNQVWIAGTTASQSFPNAQGWSQGSDFLTGFDATGSKLIYSARYPNDSASQSVAPDAAGTLHIAGPTGFISTIVPGAAPLPRIFGMANAAAGPLDARVAGGEVISIYGPHIGPAAPMTAAADTSGNLPTSIAGYEVNEQAFGPLRLLYVSDSQINAIVPFGGYQNTSLSINAPGGTTPANAPGGTTPAFPVTEVNAIPEIFQNTGRSAIAINQDGSLNSASNPAAQGSYVSIWITGASVFPAGDAGHIATAAANYACCAAFLNGANAPVTYAGAAPGVALGVEQVNLQIPPGTYFQSASLQVMAKDGSLSRAAIVYIR